MNFFMRISNGKYDDIINMPHHVSKKHQRMSLENRSAQFAPFAALTGYDDAVEETARQTDKQIEITDEIKNEINMKLKTIQEKLYTKPKVTITYFIPDSKKEGGKYKKITNYITKIDEHKQKIIFDNNVEISIINIVNIDIIAIN